MLRSLDLGINCLFQVVGDSIAIFIYVNITNHSFIKIVINKYFWFLYCADASNTLINKDHPVPQQLLSARRDGQQHFNTEQSMLKGIVYGSVEERHTTQAW
jgi:hypothetical protein